jgi:uncharacterized protein (DUF2267 family)
MQRVTRSGDVIVIDYDGFITTVAQGADVGSEEAERAARAVLETLAERIAVGEARDLQAQLPAEIAAWLGTTTPAEGFDVDEFLRRIADRTGADIGTAERYARATLTALSRSVTDDEFEDLVAELPRSFRPLLPKGPVAPPPATGVVIEELTKRTGLDEDDARRAAGAVLETLAERIAGGEVEDLIELLPAELHEPLRRGMEASGGKATRMSLQQFIARVAEREGVSPADAVDHARAVFTVLRELLPQRELFDITSQLPNDYDALLGR